MHLQILGYAYMIGQLCGWTEEIVCEWFVLKASRSTVSERFLPLFVCRECHGRLQAWQRGGTCPLPHLKMCFCALVVMGKRSVDELFMHYFHNLLSASGASHTGAPFVDPTGRLSSPYP